MDKCVVFNFFHLSLTEKEILVSQFYYLKTTKLDLIFTNRWVLAGWLAGAVQNKDVSITARLHILNEGWLRLRAAGIDRVEFFYMQLSVDTNAWY